MWANAKIDHRSTTVDSRRGSIGDFGLDEVLRADATLGVRLPRAMRLKGIRRLAGGVNRAPAIGVDESAVNRRAAWGAENPSSTFVKQDVSSRRENKLILARP